MAFEDLRVTSEEKDASILQMRQEAETAHMDLKKEKKQVEGKVPPEPFVYRLVSPRFGLDPSPFFSRACGKLSGSRQRRWECSRWLMTPPSRSWGFWSRRPLRCARASMGGGQEASSVASRLRAPGGHVVERMRGALHLMIQKTLGVVQSHYLVNLVALATGYIIADDLDDDEAQAVADRFNALAAPAAAALADNFEEVLFPNPPPAGPLDP
jgi:hypothetical protein